MTARTLTYNLSGVVRNQGLPVAGAKVIVYSTTRNFSDLPAECKISEQTTSFKGEYMIAVPPGKYRLEVQPDNSTRYLRTSVNKSNQIIDKNTISTLKENNEALLTDRDGWKVRALTAEGKNEVLQNTVTAAPDIAKLAATTAKQHSESMGLQRKIIGELQQFIKAVQKNG